MFCCLSHQAAKLLCQDGGDMKGGQCEHLRECVVMVQISTLLWLPSIYIHNNINFCLFVWFNNYCCSILYNFLYFNVLFLITHLMQNGAFISFISVLQFLSFKCSNYFFIFTFFNFFTMFLLPSCILFYTCEVVIPNCIFVSQYNFVVMFVVCLLLAGNYWIYFGIIKYDLISSLS